MQLSTCDHRNDDAESLLEKTFVQRELFPRPEDAAASIRTLPLPELIKFVSRWGLIPPKEEQRLWDHFNNAKRTGRWSKALENFNHRERDYFAHLATLLFSGEAHTGAEAMEIQRRQFTAFVRTMRALFSAPISRTNGNIDTVQRGSTLAPL
ncbi:MAG: hypothetical protein Greene041619_94 [Candidatus Peregrinibacteria bacterium Greene0416_19]|nr:MAG: hypothetical protein Greene041619_94 [Candidatus Peregrinibacteria bacterium Greene0416_19]